LLLLLIEHIISKYISFRRIVYNINRINKYHNISVEIINKYNKVLAESNTNIYLENTKPKNKSINRPGLAVSSIKIILLSESVHDRTRIRSYVELITS
jgi:phage FluMu protein Com